MLDAVILAGSVNSGALRECSNESNEAMIKIGAKPMIRYVVEALLDSQHINKIVIVGPDEIKEYFPEQAVSVVNHENNAVRNLVRGVGAVDNTRKVLVATCDIPLLTTKAVDDFIQVSTDQNVDFFYPIVPMDKIQGTYPGIQRTSVALKEGAFTGGNLFIINPWAIQKCGRVLEEFINYRKSPYQLSKLLGIKFVIKFLFKHLSLAEIENKVSEILGISGKAVITVYPEIGIDVDKPSDYSIVSSYLDKPA